VASGQRAAYATDGDLRHNVHFAAGLALCLAAGCSVSDLHGKPCGSRATGLLVSADADTHAQLLTMLAKQLQR
jgi:myo-inositol-1(or 4)-monophosphatase